MDDIGAAVGTNDMLVPSTYIHLRTKLMQLRKSGKFFLTKDEWNCYANDVEITEEDRIDRALTLFHEIGEVLRLPTGEIVLDPPELAQVLARAVSDDMRYVHNARGGYLRHEELSSVWEGYPVELHAGLLELIHECEVGFPICDDDGDDYSATLIPAMLSHSGLEVKSNFDELVEDHRRMKQNPNIVVELSTHSRRLWPELQTKLRGLAMIGGWWKNGCVIMDAFSSGGRMRLRSFGTLLWKEGEGVLSTTTYGDGRILQNRVLEALSSCLLEDFPGTKSERLDMKCTTGAAEGSYCGGWDKEALKYCVLKAVACPECGAAHDVNNVA